MAAWTSRYQPRTSSSSPLQSYAAAKKPAETPDPNRFDASKPFAFSEGYQKLQGEREGALKEQFGRAQRGLQQKEAQTKDEISSGLNRLTARVGAVGGSVERARQKAINEASQQYGEQYQDLAANEAAAIAGLKGEDVERQFQAETLAKQLGMQQQQFDLAKSQFAQQMQFSYKELDENLKTNMLNALTALKKAKISDKDLNKMSGILSSTYGSRATGYVNQGRAYNSDQEKKKLSQQYMQNALPRF